MNSGVALQSTKGVNAEQSSCEYTKTHNGRRHMQIDVEWNSWKSLGGGHSQMGNEKH